MKPEQVERNVAQVTEVTLYVVIQTIVHDTTTSARKKCALGEAAVHPDTANPPGTPWAPGASGYWLHRTVNAWCIQIMVAWQPATYCLLKGAFLGE